MRPVALMLILLPASLAALAQEQDAETNRTVKYAERTEIEFGGVEVEGEFVKPEGKIIQVRTSGVFGPLVELRADFNAEMAESVNTVK